MVQLVFLHGVGGVVPQEEWLHPLNSRLLGLGYPRLGESPEDRVTVPGYEVERRESATEPPFTYEAARDEPLQRQTLRFAARQKEIERIARRHGDGPVFGFGSVPPVAADPFAHFVEGVGFPTVSRYLDDRLARHSVWQQVLHQMPRSGHVIVVAHSLGSVVMADVVNRLSPDLVVDLLITIGSPLSFGRYRRHSGVLKSTFPFGRVLRWLNVSAPLDPVCGGRGIGAAVPQVVDVRAHLPFRCHDLAAYMSHPVVGATVGWTAFGDEGGTGRPGGRHSSTPARRIHKSWYPVLLGAAFAWQISNHIPVGRWAEKNRLDGAREEVARRAVSDIEAQRLLRSSQLRDTNGGGTGFDDVDDHPLAAGRHPTFHDLTAGAAAILQGEWPDPELLPLAVALMLQPLVPPFGISANPERRCEALESTLNVIRLRRGNLADRAFAAQVRTSVEWAKSRLADGGFPWGTVLIGSGLAVLAATGVGLVAAAPAGLAGAAVVTSTLAAFGPGGMVGGLLALSMLTGAGASLASLGVADSLRADGSTEGGQASDVVAQLASATPDTLTVTLTGMLAVVHAQLELGFESSAAHVRSLVADALDVARSEWQMHDKFAPSAGTTKEWGTKVTRLEKALEALGSLGKDPVMSCLAAAGKAVESGELRDITPIKAIAQ